MFKVYTKAGKEITFINRIDAIQALNAGCTKDLPKKTKN